MITYTNLYLIRTKGMGEKTLSFLILIQCFLFFIEGYLNDSTIINYIQIIIDCIFLIDLFVKYKLDRIKFIKSPLNILDTIIVSTSFVFSIFVTNSHTITALRVIRLFRLFRILSFTPDVEHIVKGVKRALRASRGVFFMLSILLMFFSILGYLLFKSSAPSHFADPILASYTVFSLFTVEGWNEVPSLIAANNSIEYYLIRGYVISVIVIGSFFALSLANAIFIDEMVMDNNNELEERLKELTEKIDLQNQQLYDLKNYLLKNMTGD